MSRAQYRAAMKIEGKVFAFGLAPCLRGHTLRTAGGCPQCTPALIAFAMRSRTHGRLYLAYSAEKRLVKVGMSTSLAKRISILRHYSYAGASDWRLKCSVEVQNAGRLERELHRQLQFWLSRRNYLRDGVEAQSHETYACSYKLAREALERLAASAGSWPVQEH
jgi:hypothetical protein